MKADHPNSKKWELNDLMPEGFRPCYTVGSPRAGYMVAMNGSPIFGGRAVLVKASPSKAPEKTPLPEPSAVSKVKKNVSKQTQTQLDIFGGANGSD